jgi:hypothetical protein
MSIIVIDKSPELYWYVSNALLLDEIPLKHIKSLALGEKSILQELPKIVILNGDEKSIPPAQFIMRMRNHVFARNTLYIVITQDTSIEFKDSLLKAGVSQILFRGKGFDLSPNLFASYIKWFLNPVEPADDIFDSQNMPFPSNAEFSTFARLGWVSSTHCLIESNIDLANGQPIEIRNSFFDELDIKFVKVKCVEKNKVGRFYQYANSLLCKISTKDQIKDSKKIEAWIQNHQESSKPKAIKILFFESDPDYREEILQMIKSGKRYSVRGYTSIETIESILNYQVPQLILINRSLIQQDVQKFEVIKNFMKRNFCHCITYGANDSSIVESFKEKYEFAMHSPLFMTLPLLESMTQKLEEKIKLTQASESPRVYFNRLSHLSRITLHAPAKLVDIGLSGVGVELPFAISNLSACDISSHTFSIANLGRSQFFRSFKSTPTEGSGNGFYHRLIFMGQSVKDMEMVIDTIEKISESGFEKWIKG